MSVAFVVFPYELVIYIIYIIYITLQVKTAPQDVHVV